MMGLARAICFEKECVEPGSRYVGLWYVGFRGGKDWVGGMDLEGLFWGRREEGLGCVVITMYVCMLRCCPAGVVSEGVWSRCRDVSVGRIRSCGFVNGGNDSRWTRYDHGSMIVSNANNDVHRRWGSIKSFPSTPPPSRC